MTWSVTSDCIFYFYLYFQWLFLDSPEHKMQTYKTSGMDMAEWDLLGTRTALNQEQTRDKNPWPGKEATWKRGDEEWPKKRETVRVAYARGKSSS